MHNNTRRTEDFCYSAFLSSGAATAAAATTAAVAVTVASIALRRRRRCCCCYFLLFIPFETSSSSSTVVSLSLLSISFTSFQIIIFVHSKSSIFYTLNILHAIHAQSETRNPHTDMRATAPIHTQWQRQFNLVSVLPSKSSSSTNHSTYTKCISICYDYIHTYFIVRTYTQYSRIRNMSADAWMYRKIDMTWGCAYTHARNSNWVLRTFRRAYSQFVRSNGKPKMYEKWT